MSDEAAQTSKEERTYVLDASYSQEDMLATAAYLDLDVGIGEGYRRGREQRALESPELHVLFLDGICRQFQRLNSMLAAVTSISHWE